MSSHKSRGLRVVIKGPLAMRLARRTVVTAGGCWEWTGSTDRRGYGQIRDGGQSPKLLLAHRVAFELVNGPIPDGLFVCHRCDNPSCANPDHLFCGTHSDNMVDAVRKGRHWSPFAHRDGSRFLTKSESGEELLVSRSGSASRVEVVR